MERRSDGGWQSISFREAKLPREVHVDYPRQDEGLVAAWHERDTFFVALHAGRVCGYTAVTAQVEHATAWVGDLVVDVPMRRRGVGTSLLLEIGKWSREQRLSRIVMAVQTKNWPAIRFCQSRRLSFCGYNDHFWPNQDIALFFGETVR
jgi:GNAT superfamily N-acetyltransferase